MGALCSTDTSSPSSPTILVTAAAGNSGKPTVEALKKSGATVHAAVRDVEKGKKGLEGTGVDKVISLDMNDCDGFEKTVTETKYDAVVVIPPGMENRGEAAKAIIEKVSKASPSTRIVLLSVPTAESDEPAILFAQQFHIGEEALRKTEHWTSVQLGMFFENFMGSSIKDTGELHLPIGEEGTFPVVALSDVGASLANAALKPSDEVEGKTFVVTGPKAYKGEEFAAAFAKVLEKEVKFIDTSSDTDAVVKTFVEAGWPEWQAKGMIELYGLAMKGWLQPGDGAKKLTGSDPVDLEPMIEKYKAAFGA